MSKMRHFVAIGRPKPKERPRFYAKGSRVATPKTTLDYEKFVRNCYKQLYSTEAVMLEDLSVTVYLFFKDKTHGDVDNYVKAVLDSLNGVAWKDDKQVKEINAYLIVDKTTEQRVETTIEPLRKDFQTFVTRKLEKTHKKLNKEKPPVE